MNNLTFSKVIRLRNVKRVCMGMQVAHHATGTYVSSQ